MNTATETKVTLSRRVKSIVFTGFMVLSLVVGAGAAATQAGAAAPQRGQMVEQVQVIRTPTPTTDVTAVAKPKSTAKPTPKPQPPVTCIHFPQDEWIIVTGEDPGPGGFTNCFFTSELG